MIINGDCLEEMKKMEDNSISCIVTDPPYGLGFMGKKWDAGLPQEEIWKEALRIVKPGGHILAFGGSRTYHRLTCAIEDAGWEIRDCIMWIYGSGFPKSHNHFGIDGYGTALKPAHEPIIMAMKPLDGTFKENAEKWGQAGINIDASRVETQEKLSIGSSKRGLYEGGFGNGISNPQNIKGRWPANVIFDEEAGKILDEQSGYSISKAHRNKAFGNSGWANSSQNEAFSLHNDSGGASRFFYCAKASPSERNEGLDELLDFVGKRTLEGGEMLTGAGNKRNNYMKNNHPTVKPLKLMEYLIKLVMPPKDGILLDPFAGSGSTIVAAQKLGFKAIGIEKEVEYCEIARTRLENAKKEVPQEQMDLFSKAI